jgi:YD repeat-containing protein
VSSFPISIEISYQGAGGRISTIQDTLGNTYSFQLENNRLRWLRYFNTNDTTQPTSTIPFTYEASTAAFGSGATTDPSLPAQFGLVEVGWWPLSHHFTYQPSGEIAEITYPTCGKSRYFYANTYVFDRLLNRTVLEHWVSSHDTGEGTGSWNWSLNGFGGSYTESNLAPGRVVIAVPGGATIEHRMLKSSNGWAAGFLTGTSETAAGWQDVIAFTNMDWTQDDTALATILNPGMVTHEKGVGSYGNGLRVVRTEYPYAAAADRSGNVKEIREYNYDGLLRRKTVLSYLHESYGAYVPLNIVDRVTATLVYDGSGNLLARTQTAYDQFSPLYAAANAIRHDASFGTTYTLRGLPSTVTSWYDLAQNLYVVTSMKYDECGNVREITDPGSYTSYTYYWLSAADNAYAFPLRVINAKGHIAQASYSYKSGVPLTQTDANGKVTAMSYDARDRVVQVQKPTGGMNLIAYADAAWCQPNCSQWSTPYADITEYISGSPGDPNAKFLVQRAQVDQMGRLKESTVSDPAGNI